MKSLCERLSEIRGHKAISLSGDEHLYELAAGLNGRVAFLQNELSVTFPVILNSHDEVIWSKE